MLYYLFSSIKAKLSNFANQILTDCLWGIPCLLFVWSSALFSCSIYLQQEQRLHRSVFCSSAHRYVSSQVPSFHHFSPWEPTVLSQSYCFSWNKVSVEHLVYNLLHQWHIPLIKQFKSMTYNESRVALSRRHSIIHHGAGHGPLVRKYYQKFSSLCIRCSSVDRGNKQGGETQSSEGQVILHRATYLHANCSDLGLLTPKEWHCTSLASYSQPDEVTRKFYVKLRITFNLYSLLAASDQSLRDIIPRLAGLRGFWARGQEMDSMKRHSLTTWPCCLEWVWHNLHQGQLVKYLSMSLTELITTPLLKEI